MDPILRLPVIRGYPIEVVEDHLACTGEIDANTGRMDFPDKDPKLVVILKSVDERCAFRRWYFAGDRHRSTPQFFLKPSRGVAWVKQENRTTFSPDPRHSERAPGSG